MKPIQFTGIMERYNDGFMNKHIIRCPFSVEEIFKVKGTVRVFVTVNNHKMDRALMPDGDGGHYIIFGADHRKKAGMKEGGKYALTIEENKEKKINIPAELQEALNADEDAMRNWNKLTPGSHRNIVYWVDSAKRTETRMQRAVEMVRRLTTPGSVFGGR